MCAVFTVSTPCNYTLLLGRSVWWGNAWISSSLSLSASFVASNYGSRTVLVYSKARFRYNRTSYRPRRVCRFIHFLLKLNVPRGDDGIYLSWPVVSNPASHLLALNPAVYNKHTAIETHPQEQVHIVKVHRPVSVFRTGQILSWLCTLLTVTYYSFVASRRNHNLLNRNGRKEPAGSENDRWVSKIPLF